MTREHCLVHKGHHGSAGHCAESFPVFTHCVSEAETPVLAFQNRMQSSQRCGAFPGSGLCDAFSFPLSLPRSGGCVLQDLRDPESTEDQKIPCLISSSCSQACEDAGKEGTGASGGQK